MPNTPSARKRMRQNARRRFRNRARRSRMRTAIRKLLEAVEAGDAEAARRRWVEAQSIIDRTAKAGVIHRNAAARTKSRLARRLRPLLSPGGELQGT